MSSLRPSSCWCLHCHSIKLLPHVTPLLTAAGPNIRHGDGSSAGGTQQYTDGSQLPDCFFMTNILPGSHRAEYIISLQAYLCMDGKFLFEHQSSYQLFLTRKYCSFSLEFFVLEKESNCLVIIDARLIGEFNSQHYCLQTQIQIQLTLILNTSINNMWTRRDSKMNYIYHNVVIQG